MIIRAHERELLERETKKLLLRAQIERDLSEARARRYLETCCALDERITAMLGHIGRDINERTAKAIHYRFLADLVKMKRILCATAEQAPPGNTGDE